MKQSEIRPFSIAETEQVYERYMKQDFPPEELKPFASIARMMEQGIYQAMGLFEEGELCAYSLFVLSSQDTFCLLDYLAVVKEKRGTGIGHCYFAKMKSYFQQHFPKVKGVFIECETLRNVTEPKMRADRERRIAFYLDNGAVKTPLASKLFGVEYMILLLSLDKHQIKNCDTEEIHNKKEIAGEASTQLLKDQVDTIYRRMFQKKHYDTCVKLWIANESQSEVL